MIDLFTKISKLSYVRFVFVLALIAFLIKIPAGIFGTILVHILGVANPLFSSTLQEPTLTLSDIVLAVVLAPLLETLSGQMLPVEIVNKCTRNSKLSIIISACIFMGLHYPVVEFFPSSFVIGLILAWAWSIKRQEGLLQAYITVTLIHSLHNVFVAITAALLM